VNVILRFFTSNSYLVLFLWILGKQLGLPLPSSPMFLAIGALAATRRMNVAESTSIALVAALIGDLFWYQLGRQKEISVLGRFCRLALEPDSCVRLAENFFARHGVRSLLVAKFIPGLNAVAAPIAGAIRTPKWRFILFDSLGILLWASTYETLGFVCAHEVRKIAARASQASALVLSIGLLSLAAAVIVRKSAHRRQFLASLRMARITPEELKAKIDNRETVAIVDLRHPLDFLPQPYTIPGAIRIPAEELERRHNEIPRDRDVVLYCTCPNEATSAAAVLKLRQCGITRVHPLEGGFQAWRERGFPLASEFGPVPLLKQQRVSFAGAR